RRIRILLTLLQPARGVKHGPSRGSLLPARRTVSLVPAQYGQQQLLNSLERAGGIEPFFKGMQVAGAAAAIDGDRRDAHARRGIRVRIAGREGWSSEPNGLGSIRDRRHQRRILRV